MNGDTSMNNFPIGEKPSKGPLLGTIIIVLLIVIGGIYIVSSRRGETPAPTDGLPTDQPNPVSGTVDNGDNTVPIGTAIGNETNALNGLNAIEGDINSSETDLNNLDKELQ